MSGVGANTTQLAKWLGAKDGTTSIQRVVKNPELEKLINQGFSDYGGIRGSGQAAFDKYYADWMAGAGDASRRTAEEVGNVDRFYNGGVESDLINLRARRAKALNDAAELASLRAIRGQNQSRILGSGTPSSYDLRQRMRYLGDIGVQNALDQSGQERADWDYLMNQRLGLAGRRQAMVDANTGRALTPEAVRRQFYGQNLGFLGNLGELDRANTFYGLKYDPSFAEELGTAFDNSISTMKDIYGMGVMGGGGMGGGMGGGGGAKNAAQTYGGGFWSSGYSDAPAGTMTNYAGAGGAQSVAPGTYIPPWGQGQGGYWGY